MMMVCGMCAFAQRTFDENAKPSWKERVYFGGGLSFSSGTNGTYGRYTYVGFYPIAGYMITNKFSAGSFITYQYYNYPDAGNSVTQYGISPFVRYNIGQVFLYSEYMILNTPTYDPNTPRKIYNRWLMGLGYQMPLGKRSSLNVMGLYDVLYNTSERVFSTPWVVRVFFAI